MPERIILSNKGSFKGLPVLESLDLVHDVSTFRPSASESEKADLKHRGYAITTGVLPTVGIVRIVNESKGELEDYLITYPFTDFKPNANIIGLGKKTIGEKDRLDDAVEYEERIQLKENNLENVLVGGGISNEEIKKAYENLIRDKDDYPELYAMVKDVVDESNPDPQLLRALFAKYAKEDRRNIKELRSLGLKIRNPEELETGMPLSLFLEELKNKGFRGKVEIGDYKAEFLPANLVETGVLFERETKKVYEFISFFPERIRTEGGRAVAGRINASDELYSTRAVLLKVLNKARIKALEKGNEEVKQKILESLDKAIEHAPTEKARKIIEAVKSMVEKNQIEKLKKTLARFYIENRKKFEEAMLSSSIIDTGKLIKEKDGKYFLSSPLANRGYSIRFAKKLYELSAYDEELEKQNKSKLVVGLYTHIPRLTLDEKTKEPKLENIYKPIAFAIAVYDKESLKPENIEVVRSKPEMVLEKWDKRIAGAINKQSVNALKQLKQEIAKDKSLAPIYVKFLDEAIKQIENGKVEGIVKEYAETMTKAKEELRKLQSILRIDKEGNLHPNLVKNVEKLIAVKEVAENVPYEEIQNEVLKEIKNGYWKSISVKNEIAKALFYSPSEAKEVENKPVAEEIEKAEIVEIEDFDIAELRKDKKEEQEFEEIPPEPDEDIAEALLEALEEIEEEKEQKNKRKR
jgi:hypothetical protein